ncbi:MAG TPA: ECF-type sigma factor [Pyrinomonadaceae bacterium]
MFNVHSPCDGSVGSLDRGEAPSARHRGASETVAREGGEALKLDRLQGEREESVARAELRRIARRQMSGERAGHTLQATALVNEAYLRLAGHPLLGNRLLDD